MLQSTYSRRGNKSPLNDRRKFSYMMNSWHRVGSAKNIFSISHAGLHLFTCNRALCIQTGRLSRPLHAGRSIMYGNAWRACLRHSMINTSDWEHVCIHIIGVSATCVFKNGRWLLWLQHNVKLVEFVTQKFPTARFLNTSFNFCQLISYINFQLYIFYFLFF